MPQSITEAHVKQWDDTIRSLSAQTESRISHLSVDRGTITGASFTMNRLAPQEGDMEEIVDRHGDTKFADATHTTRNVIVKDFFEALPVDRQDESKVLANPNSSYMTNLVQQYNRRKDKDFYDAARGNALDLDGNDPDFIAFAAKIGREVREDDPAIINEITGGENVEDMIKSEAYLNPKHKDHAKVAEKVRQVYAAKYGNKVVA